MSSVARRALAVLARRIHADPTCATVEDAKKLARGLLILLEGRLPDVDRG